jgi:hypothetical protein
MYNNTMGNISNKSRLERFMLKIKIEENGCWLWQGSTYYSKGGSDETYLNKKYGKYGSFKWISTFKNAKNIGAHRCSYMLFKGEIPEGMLVRHSCNDSLCVNPEHLELGNHKQNKQDSIDSKRHSFGEGHCGYRNKLNQDQVQEIIKRCNNGESPTKIAPEYGVKRETIFGIKHNRIWKHLPR